MSVSVFGYQFGRAGRSDSTAQGPSHLYHNGCFSALNFKHQWQDMISIAGTSHQHAALQDTQYCCQKLANAIAECPEPFVVIGGDHSSAMGSIQGAQQRYHGPLKLLWIDAHMDAHTFATSASKNIHGMPIAVALGQATSPLADIFDARLHLQPHNLCMIGIRAYETQERALLEKLGVRIFYMEEVLRKGLSACMQEALTYLNLTEKHELLMSIDLDAFCPEDAPGVTVPEPYGLKSAAFIDALHTCSASILPYLSGVEIAEFSPQHDQNQRTQNLIVNMLNSIWGTQPP